MHLFLVALLGCNVFSKSTEPVEQLPPATQEGKNTFGCLVNGVVWLPKGNNGSSKLDLSYDPNFLFGTLNLYAYRLDDKTDQWIALFSDSLKSTGIYPFTNPSRQSGFFIDAGCEYLNDPDVTHTGSLTITRFDLSQSIISGTFEFTVTKANCPIIEVTHGRFDMRI
jgi:hypothetical protein